MSNISETSSVRVLHVDDESQFGNLVRSYVERLDGSMTVVTETEGERGIERLDEVHVDCVVSDYQMPRMDGLEFLDAVRERYPNLPFILFTGKGSEEIASRALNAGVDFYLQKNGSESYELLVNRIAKAVGQQRSKRRAKVAQDRLIQLYEQTDGFYAVDEDWTITYWNERIAERTDRPPEAVIGQGYWDVFPEATETMIYDEFHQSMHARERVEFEVNHERYGYWAEIRAYPVDEGLFVHSRDITEKKEQSRELRYRNEILESFASTVSHDLRNPLGVAEGNLRLAQETGDFEHLEEVTQAHNRMQNLIDELLRLARGNEQERSDVSLRSTAERAWTTVSAEDADLVIDGDPDLEAYESQLRRLFENLFWNALDHGDATELRVGSLDGGFYVEDDGTGIDPDEHDRVFDSGFSSDDNSPGYGLSIVEGICEIHGWEITVTSGDGGGARFEVFERDGSGDPYRFE
jgi:PAS domain S-box-containing protein